MYLSLDWLKDFVDIPKSVTPEDLGLRLTMHTVEIDSVEKQADKLNGVVVGKILEVTKHPNADKLQLVKVDVGREKLKIVCAAKNINPGDKVPVALVGAILPNGLEIKEVEMRGEKSSGMLCAPDELGLGDDHSGILIMDKSAVIGQSFGEALGLKDVIFEVDNKSITNRPDLWSHYGIAREISAFLDTRLDKSLERTSLDKFRIKKKEDKAGLRVRVADIKLCQRYMAIAMGGIKISESPVWLKDRLIAVGLRPINNIVDVTNYVMLELGQPLHAFDAKLIKEIIVRRAKKGETIETLDGEKRGLGEEDLVIADKVKPIGIAGIMGGANSEISPDTAEIIIESANFDPISVRKTAQKFNLRTEASMRFEKSLDPNLCELALARTVELISQVSPGAKVIGPVVDKRNFDSAKKKNAINLNLPWLYKSIGFKLERKKVINALDRLGFSIKEKKENLEVSIPSWRATGDVSIPEDLLEEVVRIYGYDNFIPKMPQAAMDAPEVNEALVFERSIKDILARGMRLNEVHNYSFVGEEQLKKLNLNFSSYLRLANPIASQQTLLRQTLAPNLLENVKLNQARFENFGLFEIGNVFFDIEGEVKKDYQSKESLPYQEKIIGLLIAGEKYNEIFSLIKGMAESLLESFHLELRYDLLEIFPGWADGNRAASLKVLDREIGFVAEVDSRILKAAGIKKEVAIAEINFNELFRLIFKQSQQRYKASAKYPPVVRDLAFVVSEKILYNDIKADIDNFNKLIKKAELFDVYEGDKVGQNKKSLAFHLLYQSEDRTLTAEEVEKVQNNLASKLKSKYGAQIRNF